MKLFIKRLIFIFLGFYLFAEIIARILHISTDAPRMYQNSNNIIRYYPNQEGYWEGATHKWYINKFGFPGRNLPKSYDNLITIIGPSVISNFMNPDSCRQMEILKKINPKNNYLELSRPGSNLLDYFDFINEIDTLNPRLNLMYVLDKSFYKSIKKNSISNGTQLDLKTFKVSHSKYIESVFKNVLYNFKFAYYLYRKNLHIFNRRISLFSSLFKISKPKKRGFKENFKKEDIEDISILLDFVKKNYQTDNVVMIFNDRNSKQIYNLVKSKGFQTLRFDSQNDDWTLEGDSHWSCYGHHQAAKQVSAFLDELTKN